MGKHSKTLERMHRRVSELMNDFGYYVDVFDQASLFTGPSLYFHFKTLELLRRHDSAMQALEDDEFFDSLYATLTAWGMHRMGPRGAKLVDLSELKASFRRQAKRIHQVETLCIVDVQEQEILDVTSLLWEIICRLQVGVGKTKIVAGSKALHHLLPALVPPIDRQYTVRFFFHHTTFNQGDEKAFKEIYPCFYQIAVSCRKEIQARLSTGMNTSATKVIDNAIVGYGLEHLRKR